MSVFNHVKYKSKWYGRESDKIMLRQIWVTKVIKQIVVDERKSIKAVYF